VSSVVKSAKTKAERFDVIHARGGLRRRRISEARMKQWKTIVVLGGYLVLTVPFLSSQGRPQGPVSVDWPVAGGSPGSIHRFCAAMTYVGWVCHLKW
jgi:hypothetical protein